jgi:adenylylsulfate kinase
MIEKIFINKASIDDSIKRSIVKTISCQVLIAILDFMVIYFITKQLNLAVGFVLVSNIYTTLCFFINETIWGKINWGKFKI